jgi:transposase
MPHKTKTYYDSHLLACTLSLLNTLHEYHIDFRPLERFSFKPTIHNEKHWASLCNDHSIELPEDIVCEFEWPQQFRQDTHMQIRSYLDLTKYPEIARDYIDIAYNLFIETPIIYMQDIEASMTKTEIYKDSPVTKKRRKNSDDNPAPKKIQKIYDPLVITDDLWKEIDAVFPYKLFQFKTFNLRDAMEALCWKFRKPEKSWNNVPCTYGMSGTQANRFWRNMNTRCKPEELGSIIDLLKKANHGYEQLSINDTETVSPSELIKPTVITDQIWGELKQELPIVSKKCKLSNREFMELMCWKMISNCSWRGLSHEFDITAQALQSRWKVLTTQSNWPSIEKILLQAMEDAKNIQDREIAVI